MKKRKQFKTLVYKKVGRVKVLWVPKRRKRDGAILCNFTLHHRNPDRWLRWWG